MKTFDKLDLLIISASKSFSGSHEEDQRLFSIEIFIFRIFKIKLFILYIGQIKLFIFIYMVFSILDWSKSEGLISVGYLELSLIVRFTVCLSCCLYNGQKQQSWTFQGQ
jgi:hypothetical protein